MPVDPSAVATWANLVTISRFLVAPLAFWMFPDGPQGSWPAFLLWFVLCVSDGIDGWLARRHGTTTLGTFLDPLADKVLVLGALVVLAAQGAFAWVWVVVIAGRELAISLYRSRLSARGVSLPARRSAKWKTAVQQIAVGLALLPWFGREWPWLAQGALLVAVVLTVWSGWLYLVDARRGRARSVAA